MNDPFQTALDIVALGAFIAFTALCLRLTRSLNGSALKRGFYTASIAGFVHLIGNVTTIFTDFGLSNSTITGFPIIQALFAVLLALSVRNFFPAWYKKFKNATGNPPGFSPIQAHGTDNQTPPG